LLVPPESHPVLRPLWEQARAYTEQAKAPRTRRAYRADWTHFSTWCATHHFVSLPAPPEAVALYLTALAATAKMSTLTRRVSALSQAHQAAGYDSPTRDLRVRTVWPACAGRRARRSRESALC
jgi:site-specific recombinase XerD